MALDADDEILQDFLVEASEILEQLNEELVELADGSVKYDFISGIGVHHWGHSHPAMVEASLDAALRDTVMEGNLQQNVESVELVRSLLDAANAKGAKLKHCFFRSFRESFVFDCFKNESKQSGSTIYLKGITKP